jgi:hypothetical protein
MSIWRSGWFFINAYEPSPGYALMSRGSVGDIVAAITSATRDGHSEIFYLRYDPARAVVDLTMRIDQDSPWSLESSHDVPPARIEAFDNAVIDGVPTRVFELLIATNPDLDIVAITEHQLDTWGCHAWDRPAPDIHSRCMPRAEN